jgi:glycosyltransferase involved in cell wall biosynthesis
MKIWLPYIIGGSGVDVFTRLLARGLREHGLDVVEQGIPHSFQYAPMLLRALSPPANTDVIITNSWNGFAFRRRNSKLVVIEHLCVFDPAFTPYRSFAQGLFHDTLVRRFEKASFDAADAVVSVSDYTGARVADAFPGIHPITIHNGIDTTFFSPAPESSSQYPGRPFRIVFVGNTIRRKGADLLLPIMDQLGNGFELHYTDGLRVKKASMPHPNITALGKVTHAQVRDVYRSADVLLFPTRLEGFGYAAAEAMACGIPVVATHSSSLPEIVEHNKTGLLCRQDDIKNFADAIRRLADDPALRSTLGAQGRRRAIERFDIKQMLSRYIDLCNGL